MGRSFCSRHRPVQDRENSPKEIKTKMKKKKSMKKFPKKPPRSGQAGGAPSSHAKNGGRRTVKFAEGGTPDSPPPHAKAGGGVLGGPSSRTKKNSSARGGHSRGGSAAPARFPRGRFPARDRYALRNTREEEAVGLFRGTARGFGFVSPRDDGSTAAREEDVFIPARETGGALDGDTVRVRFVRYTARDFGEERVRTDGRVLEILTPRTHAVGRLSAEVYGYGKKRRLLWFLTPDNPRLPDEIPITDHGSARQGDKVKATLHRLPLGARGTLTAAVSEIFGDAEGRDANYAAILSELEIPTEFSEEALAEADALAARPLSREGRALHTRDLILTIDGPHAKDLDDAVSLHMLEGGQFLLSVHIADVSEYVRPRSALETAANERGTSLYFTDRVVPMLPPALSNGACSLHPGEDKYALSALITIDKNGTLLDTRIERSIIRSRVRGVYGEVNDLLRDGEASPFFPKYKAVYPMLRRMHRLYEILEKKSRARGALSLDRPEASIFLDDRGEVDRIEVTERGTAERMIEQFMLAANEGVATLLSERGFPCVYRVHDRPAPDRLADFTVFAHNLGLDVRPLSRGDADAAAFASLLEEAEARGLGRALSYSVLRTMAKAVYSAECRGHFGLGIARYCHFTSPIRRLSDLYTHRIIKAVLLDGQPPARYRATAERGAAIATDTELRALEAERAIESLYKTLYLSRRIGEEVNAVISSVGPFGIFCELPDTCEGLIPAEDLGADAFYEEDSLSLVAEGRIFRIGDPIRIRIEEADIPTRRVRFSEALAARLPT